MVEKKGGKSLDTSLAKSVQNTPSGKGGSMKSRKRVWKWSKRKRKAAMMVVRGMPVTRIADDLGVHRNTIRNWRSTPEFNAEVMSKAREYVNQTRFKRVHETGLIADQLARQVALKLSKVASSDDISQTDISLLQTSLREYREFRTHERTDFGDDVKRVEGTFNIIGGSDREMVTTSGGESFKKFVEGNADKIPQRLISDSATPQDALVEVTKALLVDTDILDKLHEEDEADRVSKEGI